MRLCELASVNVTVCQMVASSVKFIDITCMWNTLRTPPAVSNSDKGAPRLRQYRAATFTRDVMRAMIYSPGVPLKISLVHLLLPLVRSRPRLKGYPGFVAPFKTPAISCCTIFQA